MPSIKVTLQNHLKKHNIASDIDWTQFVVKSGNRKRIDEVYLRSNKRGSVIEHVFFSVLSPEQYDKYKRELKLLWSEFRKIYTDKDEKKIFPLFMKLNIKGMYSNFNGEWNTVRVKEIKKKGLFYLFGMIFENEKTFVALKSLPPQFASRFRIEFTDNINNTDNETVRKMDESKIKIIETQQEQFPALHSLIRSQNQEEISKVLRLENVNKIQNSQEDDHVENKETENKEQENKVPDNNEPDEERKTNDDEGEQTDEDRKLQLQDNEADETKKIDKVDELPHQVIEISIEGKNIPMYLTQTLELLDYITLKVVGRIQTESSFDTLEREGRTTIEWCDNYPKTLSFYKQYKERSYFMQ